MDNDVAIFLDLDNIVIGAQEANLNFDINLILDEVRTRTNGRIVLRRAYGDWRQREYMTKELATTGFELQSTVRLNNMSKNLADMQMVVDALGTLIDGQSFTTYVVITGDRDFVPLVQALRKRGKQVVGVGVRHTTSNSLVNLCDDYMYYDDLAVGALKIAEDEVSELLERALSQLLQNETSVPASLLKQRMQALSKGSFNRSPMGKQSFSKFLSGYTSMVSMYQEGTTLYVCRPADIPSKVAQIEGSKPLSQEDIAEILDKALTQLVVDNEKVRASLLKQHIQELSGGAFDENKHGMKSFRMFLEHYESIVQVEQEGTTLYVRRAKNGTAVQKAVQTAVQTGEAAEPVSIEAAEDLLKDALAKLVTEEQSRVRASLLKQAMQDSSQQAFSETALGFESFRDFLANFSEIVTIQQKGTTLYVFSPEKEPEPVALHLLYRSELKKRGLRVIPSEIRLCVIKDMIGRLQDKKDFTWRELVNSLADVYKSQGKKDYSKSYVNDVLRVARRANVVGVESASKLASSPVFLQMSGSRIFQDAVMFFDFTYLKEIQELGDQMDLEEAAIALYDSVGHTRYLKVIMNRLSENGHSPA